MKGYFILGAIAICTVVASAMAQIVDLGRPRSLQELTLQSEVILEAQPQTVFPPEKFRGSEIVYVDTLFRVTDVIKGPKDLREVVAATMGDDEFFLPKAQGAVEPTTVAGKRFILFLVAPGAYRTAGLPKRTAPRYDIFGGGALFLTLAGDEVRATLSPHYLGDEKWFRDLEARNAVAVRSELKSIASAH